MPAFPATVFLLCLARSGVEASTSINPSTGHEHPESILQTSQGLGRTDDAYSEQIDEFNSRVRSEHQVTTPRRPSEHAEWSEEEEAAGEFLDGPKRKTLLTQSENPVAERVRRDGQSTRNMSAVVTVRAVVGPGTEELIPTTIPAQLRSSLIDWLNASHVNLRHSPGEEVKFKCENNITAEFEQEFPDLRLRWLLDGGPVCLQPSRMLIHSHTLTMNSLNIRDSGLYECRMEFSGKSVPADFFALHVPADFPTLRPRETEPLTLDCNSQALVRVLRNTDYSATVTAAGGGKQAQKTTVNESEAIFRRWFHNGSVTPLLPDTISVAEPSPDTVSSASTRNLSGEWECVVTHVPTNRSWTTRWYRVFVRDPPSDLELWWRAVLAYPWVVSAVGLALVFGFIGLSILIAKKAQKKNINLEEQYQRLKQRIASRHTRTGRRISSVLRGDAEPPKILFESGDEIGELSQSESYRSLEETVPLRPTSAHSISTKMTSAESRQIMRMRSAAAVLDSTDEDEEEEVVRTKDSKRKKSEINMGDRVHFVDL